MVFLKEFFQKVDFEKKFSRQQKSRGQRVNLLRRTRVNLFLPIDLSQPGANNGLSGQLSACAKVHAFL